MFTLKYCCHVIRFVAGEILHYLFIFLYSCKLNLLLVLLFNQILITLCGKCFNEVTIRRTVLYTGQCPEDSDDTGLCPRVAWPVYMQGCPA